LAHRTVPRYQQGGNFSTPICSGNNRVLARLVACKPVRACWWFVPPAFARAGTSQPVFSILRSRPTAEGGRSNLATEGGRDVPANKLRHDRWARPAKGRDSAPPPRNAGFSRQSLPF